MVFFFCVKDQPQGPLGSKTKKYKNAFLPFRVDGRWSGCQKSNFFFLNRPIFAMAGFSAIFWGDLPLNALGRIYFILFIFLSAQ